MNQIKTASSNIIMSDFPDLDVIRVNDTYYMVSTTMHFFPGCVILRSYNLLDWEFCSYVFDQFDDTPSQHLDDNKGIYGKGMWAASLRYHNNQFYVSFIANDTKKTYLFTSDSITGPWKKSVIPGFYHDMSVLFDDDGKTYIVSGNTDIRLLEMEKDLSAPKKGGIDKIIIRDNKEDVNLGYEGSHFYKINGKYYVFMIHLPKGKMRTEACYFSDKIEGPYTGGDVLCSDLGNWNSGVAQGGIVQSNDGKWYGILFQDHGALGRIPVLVPVTFKNDFPVFGENGLVPQKVSVLDNRPDYKYELLICSDFTDKKGKLKSSWQWNHLPALDLVQLSEKELKIKTDKTVKNLVQAKNVLTQRTFGEVCSASVTLDGSQIMDGDFAGLCAFESDYAFIGLTRKNNQLMLVSACHKSKNSPWSMGVFDDEPARILTEELFEDGKINLKLEFNLKKESQCVQLEYFSKEKNDFEKPGEPVQLRYSLDHFCGVRFGLFIFSTITAGGQAIFSDFCYN